MTSGEILSKTVELLDRGEAFALATVIRCQGSTPRKVGVKMIVYPDGKSEGTIGGGPLEAAVIQDALAALSRGESLTKAYDLFPEGENPVGAVCGGRTEVFIEVPRRSPELLVFGGGHIGVQLGEMGPSLGFRVCMVDDRPDFASRERFPRASQVVLAQPKFRGGLPPVEKGSYVVVATRCHETDEEVLKQVLGKGAAYIGMVASQRKAREVFARLETEGFKREDVEKVRAPVGLPIGGDSPAEIALSILAEVVAVKNGKANWGVRVEG